MAPPEPPPPIPCSAPGCPHTFPGNLAPEVLVPLLTLHARTAHPDTAATQVAAPSAAKVEKVRRPTISQAGTSEEWNYFCQRWSEYKIATKITGTDILVQLLECTEESLRKDLTRTYGTLTGQTEDYALQCIKCLGI